MRRFLWNVLGYADVLECRAMRRDVHAQLRRSNMRQRRMLGIVRHVRSGSVVQRERAVCLRAELRRPIVWSQRLRRIVWHVRSGARVQRRRALRVRASVRGACLWWRCVRGIVRDVRDELRLQHEWRVHRVHRGDGVQHRQSVHDGTNRLRHGPTSLHRERKQDRRDGVHRWRM